MLPAVATGLPVAALLVPRVPQDLAYHAFADQRTVLGVANFWNVASNLPFIMVGIAGLAMIAINDRLSFLPELRWIYRVLFATLILTGIGSAWYHLAPSNESLVWDRLGITLPVAALFSIILGEHVSSRLAAKLFLPLCLVGLGTVVWWAYSESQNAGDLRPYALFQFMPMLLIPLIVFLYPSRFDRTAFIWWVIATYGVAKVCELLDRPLFVSTGFVSGHSLKHVVAAAAMAIFLYGLSIRSPR